MNEDDDYDDDTAWYRIRIRMVWSWLKGAGLVLRNYEAFQCSGQQEWFTKHTPLVLALYVL